MVIYIVDILVELLRPIGSNNSNNKHVRKTKEPLDEYDPGDKLCTQPFSSSSFW
jgi:hypothetical protein